MRDAGARAVERFDDRAIARLIFEGGEELEKFELFEASLGAARDDFGDPQGGPDVEAQRPQPEAGREQCVNRRERAPARGGRAAQARHEIREISEADRSEAARAEEDPEAGVLARVGDAGVFGSIAQPELDDMLVGGVGARARFFRWGGECAQKFGIIRVIPSRGAIAESNRFREAVRARSLRATS